MYNLRFEVLVLTDVVFGSFLRASGDSGALCL